MPPSMSPVRLFSTAGLLTALAGVLLAASSPLTAQTSTLQPQTAQDDPMQVTSDTPEYCLRLLDRISEMVRLAALPVPREVTDLTTEGHKMCAHGQTRPGIMRLRMALMVLEKGNAAYR